MTNKIASQLLKHYGLWFILVFFAMGVMYLFVSLSLSNYYLQQVQTKIHLHVADSIIKDHQLIHKGQMDKQAISSVFHRYMLLNPHLEIYLVGLDGKLLKYSADPKKIKRHHINIQPLLKQLTDPAPNQTQFLLGDDPRSLDQKKPFSVAYLPNNKQPSAFLYVIIQDSIEKEANRQLQESILLELSAWSFLSSLLLGVLLGGVLFYHLAKRITLLSNNVTLFKEQPDLNILPPKRIQDELDQLEHDVAEMTQKIQQQMQQLKQTDQQRRFMISSLSHDLRTPLTSMMGYIEQLQQSQPHQYLHIAYQNSLKLKHYLDQLFDLAKLEADCFNLNKQTLSISEFCYDIVLQYQQNHTYRDWQHNIQPHIMCDFDANQLERAILNLLDNAIKHSDGEIRFSVTTTPSTVSLKVCTQGPALRQNIVDHPIQIPDSNPTLPNSQSDKHSSSGLGFSIIQSIMQKHQGHVHYRRHQALNCFTLCLPFSETKSA